MTFNVDEYLSTLIERDRTDVPQLTPPTIWARRAARLLSRIEDDELRADFRDAFEQTAVSLIRDGCKHERAERQALEMMRAVMNRRKVRSAFGDG